MLPTVRETVIHYIHIWVLHVWEHEVTSFLNEIVITMPRRMTVVGIHISTSLIGIDIYKTNLRNTHDRTIESRFRQLSVRIIMLLHVTDLQRVS